LRDPPARPKSPEENRGATRRLLAAKEAERKAKLEAAKKEAPPEKN